MNSKISGPIVGLLLLGIASAPHELDAAPAPFVQEESEQAAGAVQAPAADVTEEKGTLSERASYGIGLNFGRNLSRQGANFDMDKIVSGLRDGLEGSEAWLDDEEIRSAMQEMQKQWMEEKRKERERLAETNLEAGAAFLTENGARDGVITTDSGLQYEILTVGDGPIPTAEDRVEVHYTGKLLDGTVFDSSHDRGKPAKFGVTRVIKGWTEALQMMPVGSKWKLVIPSELAYAERGAGANIGPNATLTFEVELLGIEEKATPAEIPADAGAAPTE